MIKTPKSVKISLRSGVALRQLAEVEQLTAMYFVYAIYNKIADKIYIGQTEDLVRRLNQHNKIIENPSLYTSRFKGQWELVYKEEYVSRQEALKREKQLKSYQGRLFIRRLVRA